MKVKQTARAGSLESCDVLITVKPREKGIKLELESDVEKQFGAQIKQVVSKKVKELGITKARLIIQDQGALDYALKARTETALMRASE